MRWRQRERQQEEKGEGDGHENKKEMVCRKLPERMGTLVVTDVIRFHFVACRTRPGLPVVRVQDADEDGAQEACPRDGVVLDPPAVPGMGCDECK